MILKGRVAPCQHLVRIFPEGGNVVAAEGVAIGDGALSDFVGSQFEMKPSAVG
jgi:hypothetical protein